MNKQIVRSVAVVCLLLAGIESAGVETLYDWNFSNTADGTCLSGVVSGGSVEGTSFSDSGLGGDLKVSGGTLIVQKQGGTVSKPDNNTFAGISELSSGKYWLVVEMSRWAVNAGGMDLSLMTADRPNASVASLRLVKTGSKVSVRLLYQGGLESVCLLNTSGASPIVLVLELDLDHATSRIGCKDEGGQWSYSEIHPNKLSGTIKSVRLSAFGMQTENLFGLTRLYVTNEDPFQ